VGGGTNKNWVGTKYRDKCQPGEGCKKTKRTGKGEKQGKRAGGPEGDNGGHGHDENSWKGVKNYLYRKWKKVQG